MPTSILQQLQARTSTLRAEEAAIIAAADEAGDFTADQKSRLDEIDAEYGKLDADIVAVQRTRARQRSEPAVAGDAHTIEQPASPDRRTVAERFLASDEWRSWFAANAPGGVVSNGLRVNSPPVPFKSLFPVKPRATIVTGGGSTLGGAFIVADDTGIYDNGGLYRPLTIRDVITIGQTESDTVDYVRATAITNSAAGVAEADSTTPTDTTGLVPESAIAWERVQATVQEIAHWIPATKRALGDASQVRTLIDEFLRYGLAEELEDQIIDGSGGNDLTGISNTSGIQSQAYDTDLLTTARKAKTLVRTNGRGIANAYLMHPNDWEAFDLLTNDTQGNFYFGGPREMAAPRLWGLPVVESEACTEGTAYVANFRTVTLWDRQQAQIQMSDGVENFFLKGLVAVLANMRAALGVIRPTAIVEVTLTSGS